MDIVHCSGVMSVCVKGCKAKCARTKGCLRSGDAAQLVKLSKSVVKHSDNLHTVEISVSGVLLA